MRSLLFAALLGGLALDASPHPNHPTVRLATLGDELVEGEHDLYPYREAHLDGRGPRVARAYVDLSPGWKERQRALYERALRELEAMPAARMLPSDRVDHALLLHRARSQRERARYPLREIGWLTPNGGLYAQLVGVANGMQPLATAEDFEAWLARLEASAAVFDHAIPALRAAAGGGWTTSRPLVEKALRQLENAAAGGAERSAFWSMLARYPADAGGEKRAAYEARYRRALDEKLLPAIGRLAKFVREEYLPRSRTSAGLAALPGGERAYRALVREHTTLDLAPDELHELGLAEVARIRAKILEGARSLGFRGEMRELAAWYQSQPANYPFHAPEDVIAYLKRVHARLEPRLARLFHRLPKAGFDIQLVDPSIAASASASYWRPLADGSRPGVFRMPVTDPRRTASFGLTALLLHEGMPGHHLDIGRGIELEVARFRKAQSLTVYSEGWGLYAESLGHELGVYDDPWALLGRHLAEIHRAARLVVDTGLHAKGWSRERAIGYLVEERGATEAGATNAVERYMANPGQALAYKVGELEILKLRDEARKAMGERFDLRDFHEAILGAGQLTLPLLRERVRAWMEGSRA